MAAGDVTYSNPAGNMAIGAFASGVVSANAVAAVNVLCGFQPSKVELFYKDAGASANKIICWVKGMSEDTDGINDEYMLIADAGDITFVSAGGILLYPGSDDDTEGFTIDASIMDANLDTIYWVAHR